MIVNRRSVLKGVGLSALITAPALSSCSYSRYLVAPTKRWFYDFTSAVAATLVADAVRKKFTSNWADWQQPTEEAIQDQANRGYPWYTPDIYGHRLPATCLVRVCREQEPDPTTDRLMFVPISGNYIALDSWAWRSVDAFIRQETEGKTDDDLLRIKQLLAKTVLPRGKGTSGFSPMSTTLWVAYPARDGDVEIVYSRTPERAQIVMTVTGLFTGSPGNPTVKTFKWT